MPSEEKEIIPDWMTDVELLKFFESDEIYKHRATPFIVDAIIRLLSWKVYEQYDQYD